MAATSEGGFDGMPRDKPDGLKADGSRIGPFLEIQPDQMQILKAIRDGLRLKNGRHKTTGAVLEQCRLARQRQGNLLLNVAPRGDGSIHPEDERARREAGRRLRQDQVDE